MLIKSSMSSKMQRQSIIISAGAGSGKTFRLTSYAMEVLAASNWQTLEPLLLITFTNKATLEMKQSLFAAIKTRLQSAKNDAEKKRWKMLLANFNDNSIMTIDAFFASLVRENGAGLGIDPYYSVDDTFVLNEAWESVVADLQEKLAAAQSEDVTLRDNLALLGGIDAFVQRLDALVKKQEHLSSMPGETDINSFLAQPGALPEALLQQILSDEINILKTEFAKGIDVSEKPSAGENKALRFLEGIESLVHSGKMLDFVEVLSKPLPKALKSYNHSIRTLLAMLREIKTILAGAVPNRENLQSELNLYFNSLNFVTSWLQLVRKTLWEARFREDAFSFSDITEIVGRLVATDSGIPGKMRERYKFVLIDEFQDTSPRQFAILDRLFNFAGGNTLVVGDEKQSVYYFRGGTPENLYGLKQKATNNGKKIFARETLGHNFRSFPFLIRFYNQFFANFFTGPRDYYDPIAQHFPAAVFKAMANPGKIARAKIAELENPEQTPNEGASVSYISLQKMDDLAGIVAGKVKAILQNHPEPWPQDYPFIGILLPAATHFSAVTKALSDCGIRALVQKKGFYYAPEVQVVFNLLRYQLFPGAIITDSYLKSKTPAKALAFLTGTDAVNYHQEDLLWRLLPYIRLAEPDGMFETILMNAREFMAEAGLFAEKPTTVFNDVWLDPERYKNSVIPGTNVVLITVHKSKGLKFQHVITTLPGSAKTDNSAWAQPATKTGKMRLPVLPIGSADDWNHSDERIINQLIKASDKKERQKEYERLAYVAFTRAVQSLSIISKSADAKKYSNPFPGLQIKTDRFFYHAIKDDLYFTKHHFLRGKVSVCGQFAPEARAKPPVPHTSAPPQRVLPDPEFSLTVTATKMIDWLTPTKEEDAADAQNGMAGAPDVSADIGTLLHRFFETHAEMLLNGKIAERHLARLDDFARRHVRNAGRILPVAFKGCTAIPEFPIAFEKTIETKAKLRIKVTIIGKMDLVLVDKSGNYSILDYKTGHKNRPSHRLQIDLYRVLLKEMYHLPQVDGYLLYTSDKMQASPLVHFADPPMVSLDELLGQNVRSRPGDDLSYYRFFSGSDNHF
jgi:ATP-dependent exoDNAse (exonuclease V) beta subunit